ncbi:hypothetical protein QTO30_13155 [Yoonia sp. GPGPB17]|uniref:hypothetical protein n=1 Tax=Yoonia sp. GPGPB17 TaxID=3026147 RepID=UPI0030C1FFA0
MYALVLVLSACGGGGGATDDGGGGGNGGGSGGGGNGGGGNGGGTPTSPFTQPSEAQALYFVTEMPGAFTAVKDVYNTGGFTPFADLRRQPL